MFEVADEVELDDLQVPIQIISIDDVEQLDNEMADEWLVDDTLDDEVEQVVLEKTELLVNDEMVDQVNVVVYLENVVGMLEVEVVSYDDVECADEVMLNVLLLLVEVEVEVLQIVVVEQLEVIEQ